MNNVQCLAPQVNYGMGHVIFALDTQVFIKISNVYGNPKDQMKLNLCIYEALSYMHITMETTL